MNLKQRIGLCYRILRQKPGGLLAHADRELPKPEAGDEMQPLMNQQLREMIWVFGTHGHSGFSASYARSCLDKLLAYKPLGPLTGEDGEWGDDYGSDGSMMQQNKRCSHVFRESSPVGWQAYDSTGKVFREPSGACYTSRDSRVPVTFPYTPTTEYVDVPA